MRSNTRPDLGFRKISLWLKELGEVGEEKERARLEKNGNHLGCFVR